MASEPKATKDVKMSPNEMERRRKAVREAMKEKGMDFLLLQVPGSVRWLTDMNAKPGTTLVFPQDGEMQMLTGGAREPALPVPPVPPGFKKPLSAPMSPALAYTAHFDGELIAEALKPYKNIRVGIAGLPFMRISSYQYMTKHLTTAKFEDATDLVDFIKVKKSDEELVVIKENCRLEDELFHYALTIIKPGRMCYEVRADLIRKWTDWVNELPTSIVLSIAPPGSPAGGEKPYRVIQDEDVMNLRVETPSPGGIWAEIARCICIGKIPSEQQEAWEIAEEAQKLCLSLLKPGADPQTLWNANNEFLVKHGYQKESRLYAHSLGYDTVERPTITPSETMPIPTRLNIGVHPTAHSAKAHATATETYFLHDSGQIECLHKTPKKIFVL